MDAAETTLPDAPDPAAATVLAAGTGAMVVLAAVGAAATTARGLPAVTVLPAAVVEAIGTPVVNATPDHRSSSQFSSDFVVRAMFAS